MTHFQAIAVGGANIDIVTSVEEEATVLDYDRQSHRLSIPHGQKISLAGCDALVGGNAANVSVGLSRLGVKTAIAAELGDDEFAIRIQNTLARENVDRRLLLTAHHSPSTINIVINAFSERTVLVKHLKREHKFDFSGLTADWVYLTSLWANWQEAYQLVYDFVIRTNCKLAFNPGPHQLTADPESWRQILTRTDLLFLNLDEARTLLLDRNNKLNTTDLLKNLSSLGPRSIILTDGERGAVSWAEQKLSTQPAINGPVVEKAGAGDAFASGVIAALVNKLPIAIALKWGAHNATSVIGKIGAQAGLLTKDEITTET